MAGVVHIPWYATGFRHDRLASALAGIAPVALSYGAWLGLLAALILALGGWWAVKDERTDAPESAFTPPEPRPAPPPRLTETHDRP